MRLVVQLAQCEVRCLVRAFAGYEVVERCTLDALNEAEAAHPGKLLRQIARFDIGSKLCPPDTRAGGIQAAGALEGKDRLAEAALHFVVDTIGAALEGCTGLRFGFVVAPKPTGHGQKRAHGKHRCWQRLIVAPRADELQPHDPSPLHRAVPAGSLAAQRAHTHSNHDAQLNTGAAPGTGGKNTPCSAALACCWSSCTLSSTGLDCCASCSRPGWSDPPLTPCP